MKRGLLLLSSALSLFMLSGCGSQTALQQAVSQNSQNVSFVLTNYHQSMLAARSLSSVILSSIVSGNTIYLANNQLLAGSSNISTSVSSSILSLHNIITTYIAQYNNENPRTPIINVKFFVSQVLDVHYFLDDTTGKLEQMFLLQLPSGFVGYFSIYWLGGDVFDTQTYNLD